MKYAVNGVPLDNPDLGWIFRPASKPYSALEVDLTQTQVAGRDGHIATASTTSAPFWPMTINTPPSGWEPLLALFANGPLTLTREDRPGVEIACRFAGSTPDRIFTANQWIDATFLLELTGVYWRDKLAVTTPKTLDTASVVLEVFTGMSAPVQDAVIRLKGAASGVQVTDASGAWVTLPAATAGQWVRFDANTGKCYRTTTDTWSGGEDISGDVDFGGPRGVFEITPQITAGDPRDRRGRLTITSASRTGAVIEVRGKAAYAL